MSIHSLSSKLPRAIAIYGKKPNGRKWLPFDYRTMKYTNSNGYFPSIPETDSACFENRLPYLHNKMPGHTFKVDFCAQNK